MPPKNIDHDHVCVLDCRDSDNVDIFDRRAVSGVNSDAVDVNGPRRRHQIGTPRFAKHILERFADLYPGAKQAGASPNRQCVAVAVKATRDCPETSRAFGLGTRLNPQAGEPPDEAGVIHIWQIRAGACSRLYSAWRIPVPALTT